MYKTVYMHKTIFGFEALLRHTPPSSPV
jgi:HD superfamily phosphohydrolase